MPTAIDPPKNRVWWRDPVDKVEITWIVLALIWCLIMFFMMPYWHVYGKQNLSNEAYRSTPELFSQKTQAMVDKYTVRTETDQKIPVVRPPAGSDVYLIARLWQWWPLLELEAGKSYRLHLMSMDWLHGFSLQPENINIQVHPGYEHVLTVTPTKEGTYSIVCNEYCGINHHTMTSKLYVVK
ncbi:cytochrome C oxidase subunit II [Pelomicrobium sp.]|jgi:cytochrome c oxidase subunit 2|uniref:cytochrome C oxidase subunit II n=1 Tax=Pelomicrobium sp. TaxID=2815319 RepID=UPI002FDCD273